ncbi:phytoene desaturase [Azospirillum brasilense]|uniref:Phytoene desaturase n=1 Tax=Azospirillum brasilense TaxID=192 RepID=A0A0P0EWS6_AZOBR|nr:MULTISPECIES: phytoene desaturase family protein [Azospirillum]ALJ38812.1 phytoene desaturase [Azospirillum brasilense]MDW7557935.1 phytoene desaturase family protein [Azospirillum brasilense]MDW7597524.1 phytoene desaturase family protein [Azospirillum brasilense]MDW7632752.1 phytoene desaturase family protein [Azospirillum brasilense]MDX5950808.1 phytoene desaturase family protein [Azospirillum brasilense]
MTDRIAVIGGGLGGLASAVVLAARGHKVVLLEKNGWVGGKAAVLEEGGFRFDMGPTILTVPRVLRRILAEAGCDLDRELELVRLEPQWRCFFDDGTVLDLSENIGAMAADLDRLTPGRGAGEGYRRFQALSERLHGISERFFFWKSVEDLGDTLKVRDSMNASTLSDVLALRMGSTVAGTIRSHVPDARAAQMLDHFTQYVGSSPYGSPAVLCAIAHMQTNDGVWYPMGGTRAVPLALERVARRLGVEIRTGTGVRRLEVTGKRVTAVETESGERIPVSAVVSNMDSVRTYEELVGGAPAKRFRKRRRYEPACSGVVFYLGLDRGYDHLLHHDFVFSRDPAEEFDWIYRRGEPAPDPTCYIAAPARTEPGVASPGGEALYVLVHTPYLRPHHDWSRMLPDYRRTVFDKLKRTAGMTDLEDRIRVERVLTPQDIHDRYRVLNGAIYGLASHGRFMGAFKPGNRSRDVEGLYLAGGAAHPGPGMPMVLMSGWIAADSLDQDLRSGARDGDLRAVA